MMQWGTDGPAVERVEPPPLPEGWARLRVEVCGICGTDLHLRQLPPERFHGISPGHEVVGTLLDGPRGLPDRRYVFNPLVGCGACAACRTGQSQRCEHHARVVGIDLPGGLAEWVDAPVPNLVPVTDDIDPLTASLAEPMAVGTHAVHRAGATFDSRVLVLGGGTIGILTSLLLREHVRSLTVVARHEHQRSVLRGMGIEVLREDDVMDWGRSSRPDVVIETVGGRADTLDVATKVARRGARVVVVGHFEPMPVRLDLVMMKELSLVGSVGYGFGPRRPEFETAVRAVERLESELGAILTHQYPLHAVREAFDVAGDKTSGSIKVTIRVTG